MLVAFQTLDFEDVALLKLRQSALLLLFLVLAFDIQYSEAVKFDGKTAGLEVVAVGVNIHRNGVVFGVCHLACNETLPDELVELISVSYTHLDVYKRQVEYPCGKKEMI